MIIFSLLLNTLALSPENPILNFGSLLYFVACIALPPLFFIYTQALSKDFGDEQQEIPILKHLAPSIILLIINVFSFLYFQKAEKTHVAYPYVEDIMTVSNVFALYFVFLIQICFYVPFAIKEYFHYRKKVGNLYSFEEGVSLKWIQGFIAGFVLFVVSIYVIQAIESIDKMMFGLSLFVYLLFSTYFAFQQEREYHRIQLSLTKVLTQPLVYLPTVEVAPIKAQETEVHSERILPEIAPILVKEINADKLETEIEDDQEALTLLSEKIQMAMEVNKMYLDTDLSLAKVALLVGSNTKYVSNAINLIFQKNFTTYVNEFRIEESIRLLATSQADVYTLETIAQLSGFKSRSVFITSFKKATGVTPSQFKKENS
ncbi:MAG: helix-turn-helix domain-containing protein [Bacteroidia bacterium]